MLDIQNRWLECLLAAAETGTFNKAAKRLGKSPSTVTRWIGELEDVLGYEVFDRQSNGLVVVLNERGRTLLPKAKLAVEYQSKLQQFAHSMADEEAPMQLTLSLNEYMAPTGAAEMLAELKDQWPHIQLCLMNSGALDVQQALDSGASDIALGHHTDIIYAGMGGAIVGEEDIIYVAHPGNALVEKQDIGSEQLLTQTAIIPGSRESSIEPKGYVFTHMDVLYSTDLQTTLALVAEGLGIAVMPESAARDYIKQGRVVALNMNWREFDSSIRLMLYYRLDYPYPAVIELMVQQLREWFGYRSQ
ncbi:LysR family transcriptional regulator [Agarivorans sp. 1_MG-2023]|uniref:LysR family transcriptional regulator n=1 Tax=Agarivorans sp. 1_MG-2023 TaxID=3062634 RepID=UPI0026E1D117|nr:LysR family transcriptional regulator [Agarivorans sp. 1_MG-2023]MDO6766071.1 LysR family transcriptional regulator [Agarivorans sp. 1_MG-2023]